MRNVLIRVVKKIKLHILHSVTFFSFGNRVIYEMSKNMVEPERPQEIGCLRVACWIRKAIRAKAHARANTHTHTQKFAILIAFTQQQ